MTDLKNRKKPELLSPAGNFEKMKAAIRFGADAVYCAGEIFGMRAAADNFDIPSLREAAAYAHAHGVKLYLTVNTMPHESEYALLKQYFSDLKTVMPDALIIADIGVLMLAKEMLPEIPIHLSTQANAVSSAACRAWYGLGVRRIVLARELSLDEIRAIRASIPDDLEIECFVHGSMCISYSGRCLLSGGIVGRDANRGMCAQPCRWNYVIRGYEITEEKRPDMPFPIEEHNGETFIMASKDTCTVDCVPMLCEAGINSFKIEGRMKSAYYTAAVTNVYRMAIDAYAAGDDTVNPAWLSELESVSHREYAHGYYDSDPKTNPNTVSSNGYIKDKAYLAMVLSYDEATGVAHLSQRNKMSVGDAVEVLTPGKTGQRMTVPELFDAEGNPIASTPHPYMEFSMKSPMPLREGDIIRAV